MDWLWSLASADVKIPRLIIPVGLVVLIIQTSSMLLNSKSKKLFITAVCKLTRFCEWNKWNTETQLLAGNVSAVSSKTARFLQDQLVPIRGRKLRDSGSKLTSRGMLKCSSMRGRISVFQQEQRLFPTFSHPHLFLLYLLQGCLVAVKKWLLHSGLSSSKPRKYLNRR